jgi:hypothetical protein
MGRLWRWPTPSILFDCRDADPDPANQRRIEQAIEESIRLAQVDEYASEADAARGVIGIRPVWSSAV